VDPNSGRGNGLIRDALRWPTAQGVTYPSGGANPFVAGAPDFDGVCETCHTQTNYHRNDGGGAAHNAGQTCTNCHAHEDGFAASGGCNDCHGSVQNAAPPVALSGSSDTADVQVGAHQAHLADGLIRRAVACDECHVVPGAVDAAGHLGPAPAEVTFGVLAAANGLAPAWNRGAETCANTWCHGGDPGITGGAHTAPVWTVVDGTQSSCGSCHGAPPPAPHVDRPDCNACHPQTVLPNGAIDLAGGRHLNGVVESQVGCDSCHGANGDPAPPTSLSGASATTQLGVGAHQAHLNAGTLMNPLACTTCHVVPDAVDDPGHLDTPAPAELVFNALARADGADPTWNRGAATCANTYCHGSTLNAGGTQQTPSWTLVDGSQAACGTCHGSPPPAPHAANPDCDACHPDTVLGDNSIDLAGGLHINGVVEANSACDSCHGSPASPAPPVDLAGGSATTRVGVGAHRTHLLGGNLTGPMPCSTCHVVPAAVGDPGHLDPAPAELTFNALAGADGANPTWDPGTATCAHVYCHGATLNAGGTNHVPLWTRVDETEAACGTCHGEPPPAPHPAGADCNACHPQTVLADGRIDVPGGRHINGVVESQTSCNSCHGSAANPAPPTALSGAADTSNVGVGAHQAHLLSGQLMGPIPCDTCHVVPGALGDGGHTDTAAPAEVVFDGRAVLNGATPTWNRGAATCADTYCHGATLGAGGTIQSPNWTLVNGSQDACGTCHGNPPPAPHVQSPNCNDCHAGTVGADHVTIDVGGGLHINGLLEAAAGNDCLSCHNAGQGPRRVISGPGGDFVYLAHHVSDGSANEVVTNADCQVCHDQAQHQVNPDPEVLLNDPDGAASHTYDGAGASVEGFCLGCHDSDRATAFGAQPFSAGGAPSDVSSDWGGSTHGAALANEACLACHGGDDPSRGGQPVDRNVHGSGLRWMLSNTIGGEAVGNPEEAVCLACHDSNGPASTDLQAEMGKAYAHGVGASSGVHTLVESLTGSRDHVECGDCHSVHAANGAAPAGPGRVPGALRGVAGLDTNGNVVDPALYVYQVCYKCHADSAQPFGGRVPRQLNEASLRADFDPGRASYHPVEAAGRNADVPSLINGMTENSIISCTDCHANDDLAGVAGPHGSTWPWLLERRYETGDPSALSSARYALCFKCHSESDLMNDNSFAEHDKHIRGEDAACSVCHDPHGSDQTHLINFDTRVVTPNSDDELWWRDDGDQQGSCSLLCHGEDHRDENY
jgi:predicted CxxxxCH...CXXCH cytochrome family protein